jgi:peptidyl-prolyl cis-trans isomerase A (cyclophilin A)
VVLSSILVAVAGICLYSFTSGPATSLSKRNRIAVVETCIGTMEFKLYEDKAPVTTSNFIELAEESFYDRLIFHSVVKGFVGQGDDPTGTGMGDSGKTIPSETRPDLKHGSVGVLSMANSGLNTGSSVLHNLGCGPALGRKILSL